MQRPPAEYTPRISRNHQTIFGGYNHTSSCGEGEIYDMKNIGHEEFPVLTPRKGRTKSKAFDNTRPYTVDGTVVIKKPEINEIMSADKAFIEETYVSSSGTTTFYLLRMQPEDIKSYELPDKAGNYILGRMGVNNVSIDKDLMANRVYAVLNKRICRINGRQLLTVRTDIDGLLQNESKLAEIPWSDDCIPQHYGVAMTDTDQQAALGGGFTVRGRTINALWVNEGSIFGEELPPGQYTVVFQDGTYKDESAEANTMYCAAGFPDVIKVGDAITISGCNKEPKNNKTVIVREISDEHKYLRFYENTFTLVNGAATTEQNIALERRSPFMQYVCEYNNRIFGCFDDTIYACKLGDPFNWSVFDGLSTDAYSVEVASAERFTGCCSYGGYVLFFKEDKIYKLYNVEDIPLNWRLVPINAPGVKKGCDKSIAAAGGYLFWLSPKGIVCYSGSLPQVISAPLGEMNYETAAAGSDGTNYYISLHRADGTADLFVFDTAHGLWFKHDNIYVKTFIQHRGVLTGLVITPGGNAEVWEFGKDNRKPSDLAGEGTEMESFIEFGDILNNTTDHKYAMQLSVTAEVETGGSLDFYISCDCGNTWEAMGSIAPTAKATTILPIAPVRCDFFRIKVAGKGIWKIYAIARSYIGGTER